MLGADPAVAVWVGFGSGTTIGRKMVLAKGPGRDWRLGMLCGRAGAQAMPMESAIRPRVALIQRVGEEVVTDVAQNGANLQAAVGGYCAGHTGPTGRPPRCKSSPRAS